MPAFRVQQIDHVELFVPDRYEAAAWYRRVFGCEVVPQYESWATQTGPLMISPDGGATKLALFTGPPQGARATAGFHLVAFRVDAAGFLTFLDRLDELQLHSAAGKRVSRRDAVDHELAWSIYFCDPYGHRFEITTYEHEPVARRLGGGA
jgi:catechol 2,3-dioxygenase-like lactoylglutathione lyase family enzyme